MNAGNSFATTLATMVEQYVEVCGRSPTRSGNKEVEENLKETRNGPDANERKSGESQSKVEDWRTHLSKMRRSPLDCIHRALLGVRVGVSTIG